MAETRAIWAAGNEYLTQAAPWTHYKTDIDQAAVGVRVGLNLVALFGVIAQPIIPDAADKILTMKFPRPMCCSRRLKRVTYRLGPNALAAVSKL